MRFGSKLRAVFGAVVLAGFAVSATLAQQVHGVLLPPPGPVMTMMPGPHGTMPKPNPVPQLPLPTPQATPTAQALPAAMSLLGITGLGPKIPLNALPPLPGENSRNTGSPGHAHMLGQRRRIMSATDTSIEYNTVSGCSTTIGYIFNVGCQIQFQLAFCPTTDPSGGQCNGTMSLPNMADTYQDYYIDANSSTAQTIGCTYKPSVGQYQSTGTGCTTGTSYLGTNSCTTNGWNAAHCPFGPIESLTLNNAGTVVLATLDTTANKWVAEVYITVGASSGLLTFSDAPRRSPQTQFTIPTGASTNTVYLTVDGAQYSDFYVVYIENTSVYSSCTGILGPAPAGPSAGLCNPMAITGTKALSSGPLYMQWTFGSGTNWTALTTGTYSLVAYDQTQNKRVSQTQISLSAAASAQISFTANGGNASPAPAPASTPSTRFAFDDTTDASDSQIVQSLSGLTNGHNYCVSFTDPEGRVYEDWAGGTYKFSCQTAGGTTMSITHNNVTAEQPDYFAPNTYTVQACDYSTSPCTLAASQAFQLLGYHLTTDFTDATGTTNQGTSMVVPKTGSTNAGLYFLNDGDTYYGDGNGDTLAAIEYSTGGTNGATGNGSYFVLTATSVTGLTGTCTTSCTGTVTDSNGQTWNVSEVVNGGGANKYTTLEICPPTWGTTCTTRTGAQTLAMNGSITIPNITFFPPPGASNCTGGNCQAPTTILPQDGQTWSDYGSSVAGDLTYFTNSGGNTYAGTGSFIHLGLIPSGCTGTGCTAGFNGTVTAPCTVASNGNGGKEEHGYYTNFTQALYALSEPFTPTTGQGDVYCVRVTNNSTSGTMTGLAFTLPSTYSGATTTVWSVDVDSASGGSLCSAGNTCWAQDTTSGKCLGGANFCIKPAGTNPGVQVGTSQTIYLDVQNLPSSSFNFADVSEQVYNPVTYNLTADTTCCTSSFLSTIPVGSTAPTQSTVDSLAIGAYSIDQAYMTPLFNPTSEGTSTNNTVNVSMKNTATSQDTNPDYVDAVVFEFPNNSYLGAPSVVTPNWTYLGSTTPGAGGGTTVDYWFGVCAAQFSTANGPVQNPTTATTKSLPRYAGAGGAGCSAAQEQNALSPGSSFSFNVPIQTGAAAGTINATAYAHGANANGWSKGSAFALTVSATSATMGFSQVGTYGSPSSVPSNTTPQISTDTNTTFGNSYVYTITNTSSTGHNITSATITVPGKDSSGALPSDGTAWTITAAPTITGSAYGCTLSTSANNGSATVAGANGTITISGGSCSIPPNSTITISFPAKAPYTVNDQYQFPAVVNGAINGAENWVGDSYVQIVLGANILVTVDAASNVKGNALTPVCPTCSFSPGIVNFGNGLAAPSTTTGTDIVLVDVWTNASSPIGWDVYVTQSATNATAAPYLKTDVDTSATKSYQPQTGTTILDTAYTSIPVTASYASGIHLVTTGGTTATRSPFEFSNNYQIVIPAGGNTAANTSTVTYTFISN